MAKFTVRVELHRSADEGDYEVLHAAMERRGFSRLIVGDNGTQYHLPPAEYNLDRQKTRAQVFELAKAEATETNLTYAVLVTESNGRTWTGLEKA